MEQLERKWKPINGYEGLYDLSDDGLFYSYPRNTTKGGYSYGNYHKRYLHKTLYKNGKGTLKRAHQWVWITFVGPIPKGYDVHHINHNPIDNRIENLELIEKHKHHKMHLEEYKDKNVNAMIEKTSKPVLQYTKNMELVAEYPSTREAARIIGISQSHISRVCIGKRKTAGGYVWKFKEVA